MVTLMDCDGDVWTPSADIRAAYDSEKPSYMPCRGWLRADIERSFGPVTEVAEPRTESVVRAGNRNRQNLYPVGGNHVVAVVVDQAWSEWLLAAANAYPVAPPPIPPCRCHPDGA